MSGFRKISVGTDPAAKHILKFSDSDVILKIIEDDVKQWNECWPSFIGNNGTLMRRFVCSEDNSNMAALVSFKKNTDIKKICKGDERLINNWNAKMVFACKAIVGMEQKVKNEAGKIVRKIAWDKTAKIFQFGISVFRKLEAINHNPSLIEAAENKEIKMANPDEEGSEGYNCTDVYALRISKVTKGKKTEYSVQADKLVGIIKKDIDKMDEVTKDLAEHVKPSKESDIDAFLAQIDGSSSGAEEAESVEDSDVEPDVEEKPVKKVAAKKVDDDEPSLDEEEVPAEKPAKKAAAKKDEDDLDIEDIDLDEAE